MEKAQQPCCAQGPTPCRCVAAGGGGGDGGGSSGDGAGEVRGLAPPGLSPPSSGDGGGDGDGGNDDDDDDDDEGWHAPCGAVGTGSGTEIN